MENIPQYRQLYEILRKHIMNGVYEEGSLLPSENEFCAAHNMTRPTVRHALDSLVKDGLILKKQGKGSIVRKPPQKYWNFIHCRNSIGYWSALSENRYFSKTRNSKAGLNCFRLNFRNSKKNQDVFIWNVSDMWKMIRFFTILIICQIFIFPELPTARLKINRCLIFCGKTIRLKFLEANKN